MNIRNQQYHKMSSVYDDNCSIKTRVSQSENVGNYARFNYFGLQNIDNTMDVATNERALPFQDGYGVSDRVIQTESRIKNDPVQTNPRCRLNVELNERPYKTVPYMGRGRGNQYLESYLQQSKFVREKAYCGNVTEKGFPQVFTPQISHLQRHVQNPKNLIEQVADPSWVRGGAPSRLIIRDASEDCQYNKPQN
jgi:hypothetical protein